VRVRAPVPVQVPGLAQVPGLVMARVSVLVQALARDLVVPVLVSAPAVVGLESAVD
jgi:hypothetical protein